MIWINNFVKAIFSMKIASLTCFFLCFQCEIMLAQKTQVISTYDSSKVLFSKGYKKNNLMHGKWIFYYPSGNVESIEHFHKGRPTKTYTEFYENGKVKVKGMFSKTKIITETKKDTIDGTIITSTITSGCPIGFWEFFDSEGKVKRKYYKDCKEIENSENQ